MKGIRKTITFDKEVHDKIQKKRGKLLIANIEKSFTKMVNELLRGALKLDRKRN